MNEPRPQGEEWDVFISYAREDYRSARDLQDALRERTTANGSRPKVYLDVSREGTTPGENFEQFLAKTLAGSRHIVALYSPAYFRKELCQWELHQSLMLQQYEGRQLIPVLIDPAAEAQVPYVASKIHWLQVTRPNWFEELSRVLGLAPITGSRRSLRFADAIPDVLVNHTLPELRVMITGADGSPVRHGEELIALTTEPAEAGLSGTRSVSAEAGTASFRDLSFSAAVSAVRLVASAPGCDSIMTPPFQVQLSVQTPTVERVGGGTVFEASGRPVFFPDGRALAVLDGNQLRVHQPEADGGETARLIERVRLWARGPRCLAVADWSGRVIVAEPSGSLRVTDLAAPVGTRGMNVPGALAFHGDNLFVGMWNGTVWSLPADGTAPQQVWEHPAGIQQLAVDGDDLLVCGLDGRLTVHPAGLPPNGPGTSHSLEPFLLGIVGISRFALIVGERNVHRLDKAAGKVKPFELPVTSITGTLLGPELSTIIDAEGRGICFDSELRVRVGFYTIPGARPVSADQAGRLVVFEYPDGSYALMRNGRIVFTTVHSLAVSPDGLLVALSSGTQIALLPPDELRSGQETAS
jgi:hypothetical protein